MNYPGVYTIFNKITDECYVGSSVNMLRRWKEHVRALRQKTHCNSRLQAAWNHYGPANFKFRSLWPLPASDCAMMEQAAIDILRPEYNICQIVGQPPGVLFHTAIKPQNIDAWKNNISTSMKARGTDPTDKMRAGWASLCYKRWITDGATNRRIHFSELETLPPGFKPGITKKPRIVEVAS